jgi:nucleoside-diphosphate-sugar epimerase
MRKISIIGLGWLGTALASLLKAQGHTVLGSTTTQEKLVQLKASGLDALHFYLSPQPEGTDFDRLFQSEVLVITLPPRSRSGEDATYLAQLQQLRILLDASTVKHVIFISSTGIYSEQGRELAYEEEEVLTATTVGNPTLLLAEQLMDHSRTFALTILRFGGLMGEDRIPGRYFSDKVAVKGHSRVNFIHQQDAASMVAWVIAQGLWNQTYNGVAPLHPRRREVYEKNTELLGIRPPLSYEVPLGTESERIVSAEKIQNTGFVFAFPDPLSFSYRSDKAD